MAVLLGLMVELVALGRSPGWSVFGGAAVLLTAFDAGRLSAVDLLTGGALMVFPSTVLATADATRRRHGQLATAQRATPGST
jgi:hypothetical protein